MYKFYLLITLGLLSASAFAQHVTLAERNTALNKVFDKISTQTGYDFLISTENLKVAKPVTINVREEALRPALEKIFAVQPLSFVIQEKMVVVSKKNNGASLQPDLQVTDIYGLVSDENGTPLQGATVNLKGTAVFTQTGGDGSFRLSTAMVRPILVISYIGFQEEEYGVDAKEDFPLKIQLKAVVSALNQVQVIGYGETTKRLATGSTGTVSAKEIEKQPVSNPLATLQGRISGVLVQTQNGLPGGGIKVQIRGQGSLASGTDPLYIIDGIPFLSSALAGNTAVSGANGAISPLSIINPDDIDRIDVLKDADATAIYGSRAANGVVLITTKKGAKGRAGFTVNLSEGLSRISRLANPLLSLPQYLQLRREAFANDGQVPDMYNAPDLMSWDTTRSTNWQKYFYGGTARVRNVQASLSGGDERNQFLLSGSYRKEGTILPGDESYTKGGGYFTFSHHSDDNKFTTTTSVNYNKDDNKTLYFSTSSQSFLLPPNFPVYNPDGTFNWDIANPVAALQQRQQSKTDYLNVNQLIDYKFTGNLSFHLNSGYNTYRLQQIATLPLRSQNPAFDPLPTAYFGDNLSERYILEPQVNFNKTWGGGVLTALAGGTYQYQKNTGTLIQGDGVSNPTLLGNLGAASTIGTHTNSYALYKYVSVFSRINYNWHRRYLLNVNFRRDGSSRFGPDHQFGNFYAVGAAWIFSEARLFKDHLPFISYGKLRASVGTTGNDQISDYQYLASYGTGTIYNNLSTLTPSRVANPDYSWETTRKLEAALEIGLLSDRLLLTAAWYKHTSSNQLIAYKIPFLTGFATYQANFPATIENTGIEVDINARIVQGSRFKWQSTVNLTIPRNQLKSFPNLAGSSYANNYVVGQDLSVYKGLRFLGVDRQTGNATFADINQDGSVSAPGDLVVLGKTSPDLYGGWTNNFSWKRLEWSFALEFVKRKHLGYQPLLGGYPQNNPLFVVERWRQPGDITDVPRASINLSASQYNSSQLLNASYARVRNVAVSYTLPDASAAKIGMKSLKIYLNGENLFVIASKDRFDPEISGVSGGMPPLKTLVFGLKAIF